MIGVFGLISLPSIPSVAVNSSTCVKTTCWSTCSLFLFNSQGTRLKLLTSLSNWAEFFVRWSTLVTGWEFPTELPNSVDNSSVPCILSCYPTFSSRNTSNWVHWITMLLLTSPISVELFWCKIWLFRNTIFFYVRPKSIRYWSFLQWICLVYTQLHFVCTLIRNKIIIYKVKMLK